MLGYDFFVEYKMGKEILVADGLSRQLENTEVPVPLMAMISVPHIDLLEDMKTTFGTDLEVQARNGNERS